MDSATTMETLHWERRWTKDSDLHWEKSKETENSTD